MKIEMKYVFVLPKGRLYKQTHELVFQIKCEVLLTKYESYLVKDVLNADARLQQKFEKLYEFEKE